MEGTMVTMLACSASPSLYSIRKHLSNVKIYLAGWLAIIVRLFHVYAMTETFIYILESH